MAAAIGKFRARLAPGCGKVRGCGIAWEQVAGDEADRR
jgi:hypothetical protein